MRHAALGLVVEDGIVRPETDMPHAALGPICSSIFGLSISPETDMPHAALGPVAS